jgi:hypothetical protein
MKTSMVVIALLAAVLTAGGCRQTYVTVGDDKVYENVAASFKFGMLESVLSRDVDTLVAATEKAMAELKMPVVNKGKDKLVGKVEAYTSDGKDVTINMTSLSEGVTRLTIVVGSRWGLGDESRSREIFAKILENGGWKSSK